jgi:hypothetical protein
MDSAAVFVDEDARLMWIWVVVEGQRVTRYERGCCFRDDQRYDRCCR